METQEQILCGIIINCLTILILCFIVIIMVDSRCLGDKPILTFSSTGSTIFNTIVGQSFNF